MNNLHALVARFCENWGPKDNADYNFFVSELRDLLEAYGAAALQHQSFPDTDHEHGDPIERKPQ